VPSTDRAKHGSERRSSSRCVTSRDLLAGARELVIEHDGRYYVLRITQNGKLILTA
jgi:hemin uptake protein HemP